MHTILTCDKRDNLYILCPQRTHTVQGPSLVPAAVLYLYEDHVIMWVMSHDVMTTPTNFLNHHILSKVLFLPFHVFSKGPVAVYFIMKY